MRQIDPRTRGIHDMSDSPDIWSHLMHRFDARRLVVEGVGFRTRPIESKTHYLSVVFGH